MDPEKARTSAAWRKLEQLLYTEGWNKGNAYGFLTGYTTGRVEGRQEALYLLFQARGIRLLPEERLRILRCKNRARLERWIKRAVTSSSVHEVLELKSSAPAGQRRSAKRVRTTTASRA